MDYLARREHSSYELSSKLNKKFPDAEPELIGQVLSQLGQEKLQSDERFAEAYVRYRKTRGFAYNHIRADLNARRVDESIIDAHLYADDEDWQSMLEGLLDKKLGNSGTVEFGSKQHRRVQRFLESRGFLPLDIRRAIEKRLRASQSSSLEQSDSA